MRKPLVLKCLFIIFAAMFLVTWMGSAFDDDASDSSGVPDWQPAALLTDISFIFTPEFSGYHKEARPLMRESYACYIEMHEKSPPVPAFHTL